MSAVPTPCLWHPHSLPPRNLRTTWGGCPDDEEKVPAWSYILNTFIPILVGPLPRVVTSLQMRRGMREPRMPVHSGRPPVPLTNPPEIQVGDQKCLGPDQILRPDNPCDHECVCPCKAQTGLWRAPQVQSQLDPEFPAHAPSPAWL